MRNVAICLWNTSLLADYTWLLKIFLGLFAITFLYFICKKIVRMGVKGPLKKISQTTKNWDKILFPSIKVIFSTLSVYFVFKLFANHFGCIGMVDFLKPFKNAIVLLCFSWSAYRWKQDFLQTKLLNGEGFFPALGKLFSIAIVLITAIAILRIFNLDIVPLVAFGGIGAAALGFAAKDVMSSFFGGLLLSMTRPFSVGDLILIPDRNVEGFVEDIGWCLTSIRDKDKRAMYLPNSLFSDFLLINASRRTGRRIQEKFRVRYADFHKIALITQEIKASLKVSSFVDNTSPILVFFSEIGSYSLDLELDVYTMHTSWKDYVVAKEEVLKVVVTLIKEQGMEMAYPVSLAIEPGI